MYEVRKKSNIAKKNSKRKKLQREHIESIRKFVSNQTYNSIKRSTVRTHFYDRHPGTPKWHWVRWVDAWSKIEDFLIKSWAKFMLVKWAMRMIEGSSSQQLYSADCLHKVRSWSSWTSSVSATVTGCIEAVLSRGRKGIFILQLKKIQWVSSLILSANRVYGIMGTDETVNYKVVRHFIT